jgi:NADH-quinone oxidoreductase subunit C/D
LLSKYRLTILNDKVQNVDLDLNFNSRNILSQIRGKCGDLRHLELMAHVDYVGRYTYQIAFLRGLEAHLQIVISDQVAVVRMLFLELSRILEHLYLLMDIFAILGIDFKKDILGLIARINVLLATFIKEAPLYCFKLGGGTFSINNNGIVDSFVLCKDIEKFAYRLNRNLNGINRKLLFLEEGKIDFLTAIRFGITGPALRAAGINYDVRKHRPYYFYKDMIYEVPLGIYGGVRDHIMIRIDEMIESLKIVFQLCTNIPVADTSTLPGDGPTHYASIETARGELGAWAKTDGDEIVEFDMTNPSLPLYLVLSELSNVNVHDMELIETSLGISYSELSI